LRKLFRQYRQHVLDALHGSSVQLSAVNLQPPDVDIIRFEEILRQLGVQLVTNGQRITDDFARKTYFAGTNYGTLSLKRAGISFALGESPADWRVIDALKVRNLSALRGIKDETNKQIILELTDGIQKGESVPKLAKRISDRVDHIGITRATAMARTEAINAFTQGAEQRYTQAGIETLEWLVARDDRLCEECEPLDGKQFSVKSRHPRPPLHPQCFIEGTRFELTGDIVSAIRGWYRGEIIELTLSDGRILSITPNHMLLTTHGFCAANLIRNGDDIICRTGFERIIDGVQPNEHNIHPTVKEVFRALHMSDSMLSMRMPPSAEYLHTDGEFVQGDIDIIYPKCFLLGTFDSTFVKHLNQDCFDPANSGHSALSSNSSLSFFLNRLASTTSGGMSGGRETDPFFIRRLTHPEIHRFASTSRDDLHLRESTLDNVPGHTKMFSELLDRHPRVVQTQNVVNINVNPYYHGYVYDFQTLSTLCIGNGVVTSNCRCTIIPVI
jgi:SPP1 gp7 family putative phage head morphogenesis protein